MQVVTLVDDLDKESTADETVSFSLDGTDYVMDLNGAHAAELREIIGKYIPAARRSTGKHRITPVRQRRAANARAAGQVPPSAEQPNGNANGNGFIAGNDEIRAWLKANGFEVKDRGRISATLVDTFKSNRPIARAS